MPTSFPVNEISIPLGCLGFFTLDATVWIDVIDEQDAVWTLSGFPSIPCAAWESGAHEFL